MNRTANKTAITISATTVKPTSQYTIKKRIEYDAFGRQHVAEYVRGIRI